MKTINDFSLDLLIWQIFTILLFGLLIYCVVDIMKNSFKNNDKLIWTLIVLFIPVLGPILYVLIGRKQKLKTA